MSKKKIITPDLHEFIDPAQRPRKKGGFKPMSGQVSVAVYPSSSGYQTLTIRFSEDVAAKHKLVEGSRWTCHVHPDQEFVALKPGVGGTGSSLFRPRGGRSLVYQNSLRDKTLVEQQASPANLVRKDDAIIIALT